MTDTCAITERMAIEPPFDERDPTDLGLPPLPKDEPRIPRPRVAGDVPSGPPASPESAAAHSAAIRARMGWEPAPSMRLAHACPDCDAPPREWCRQHGREVRKRLCPVRR